MHVLWNAANGFLPGTVEQLFLLNYWNVRSSDANPSKAQRVKGTIFSPLLNPSEKKLFYTKGEFFGHNTSSPFTFPTCSEVHSVSHLGLSGSTRLLSSPTGHSEPEPLPPKAESCGKWKEAGLGLTRNWCCCQGLELEGAWCNPSSSFFQLWDTSQIIQPLCKVDFSSSMRTITELIS